MSQTWTNDFWGLYKKMNCSFPLINIYWDKDVSKTWSKVQDGGLWKKNSNFEGSKYVSGFKYVRVLNIHINVWKYSSVLNILWGAIEEGFWIFHAFKYARFLCMQALHKVLNVPEYSWIIPYDWVLNMPCNVSQGFE